MLNTAHHRLVSTITILNAATFVMPITKRMIMEAKKGMVLPPM